MTEFTAPDTTDFGIYWWKSSTSCRQALFFLNNKYFRIAVNVILIIPPYTRT